MKKFVLILTGITAVLASPAAAQDRQYSDEYYAQARQQQAVYQPQQRTVEDWMLVCREEASLYSDDRMREHAVDRCRQRYLEAREMEADAANDARREQARAQREYMRARERRDRDNRRRVDRVVRDVFRIID